MVEEKVFTVNMRGSNSQRNGPEQGESRADMASQERTRP